MGCYDFVCYWFVVELCGCFVFGFEFWFWGVFRINCWGLWVLIWVCLLCIFGSGTY